ncbi:hypothetical protein IID23_05045 [Patescibacteria group bacterium]|nr:hypothetical protein [Patescibacteria group bacterium]
MLNTISNSISNSEFIRARFWIWSGRSELSDILWFVILSLIFILIGILGLLYLRFFLKDSPPKRKLLTPFSWGSVAVGISGIVFAFFRKEGVGFFSAFGFWVLVILAGVFMVSYFGFRYFKVLPKEQKSYDSYILKKKYLPKRKKKL